jgi:hypothetical protein
MWNCGAKQIHFDHVLAGAITRFTNCIRHFACLAHANTDATIVVTSDHNSAECETTPTLDYFGRARDMNNALVQFFSFFSLLSPPFSTCHLFLLEIQPAFAAGVG